MRLRYIVDFGAGDGFFMVFADVLFGFIVDFAIGIDEFAVIGIVDAGGVGAIGAIGACCAKAAAGSAASTVPSARIRIIGSSKYG